MLRKSGKNLFQNMPKKNHRLDSAVVFPFYTIHTSTFRVFYASVFYITSAIQKIPQTGDVFILSVFPLQRRCHTCGLKSPTRYRTMRLHELICPPEPWSGRHQRLNCVHRG